MDLPSLIKFVMWLYLFFI